MQKNLQQLDLFGMPVEPQPAPAPKKEKPVQEAIPVVATQPAQVADDIVFADKQIVVKIKAKPVPAKEEVAAPATIAVPVEIAPPAQTTKHIEIATPAAAVSVPEKKISKRGRKSFKEINTEIDMIEVPEDEVLRQKLYYSISEVAAWFKVNTSLLRYWENEFDVLKPRKTRKGDRLFRFEDIKNLQLIYFLLRQRKFSIEGARNYLKQNKQQADTQAQLVQSLTKFRSFLLELKANLA